MMRFSQAFDLDTASLFAFSARVDPSVQVSPRAGTFSDAPSAVWVCPAGPGRVPGGRREMETRSHWGALRVVLCVAPAHCLRASPPIG